MRIDCRSVESEVFVVLDDLFINRLVVDGHRRQGKRKGNLPAGCTFRREESPLNVIIGSCRYFVVIDGDELDAGVSERDWRVAVVGEDDADGDEAVGDIGQAEEVALFDVVAWLGRHSNMLVGMSVEGGVLIGRLYERRLAGLVGGEGGYCEEAGRSY